MARVTQTERGSGGSPGPNLGFAAAKGFTYVTAQAVLLKMSSVLGQVALAWLLEPRHFGLVGLCYSVTSLIGVMQNLGLGNVLVQRQRAYQRWAGPILWLSLSVGCVAGFVMFAAAPVVARIYDEPGVTGLIRVVAVGAPLTALMIVPMARLQIDLQFRTLAIVGIAQGVGQMVLSVLFAYLGFGAYSFVLPLPLVAIAVNVVLWTIVGVGFPWRPRFRKWRYVAGDGLVLTLGRGSFSLISQGDYIVLGMMYASETVGTYFFAFNLSLQFVSLIAPRVVRVLFPVLSRMQATPQRQFSAFVRVQRTVAHVTLPAALLQAAIAAPLIHLVFEPKWYDAIPLVQILCLGVMFAGAAWGNTALLFAQRRYWTFLVVGLVSVGVFYPLAVVGAYYGGAMGIAIGVAVYNVIAVAVGIYATIRPFGGRLADVVRVYRLPLLLSLVAIGPVWLATLGLGGTRMTDILRLGIVGGVSVVAYWFLLGIADPGSRSELLLPLRAFRQSRTAAAHGD
jgi:O-antigen/teichoic acid export membrane protein